jgi:hypothetical protein
MKLLSEATQPYGPDDILAVVVVRNEMLRLPDFLAHHRRLGVARFLVVDNASDDGTTDFLSAQPDVDVFFTSESYAASNCGVTWTNALLQQFAVDRWTLVLDADELFVFPGFETTSLPELVGLLDAEGAQAMIAPLLDMYSPRSLLDTGYVPGQSMLAVCPMFDSDGYEWSSLCNVGQYLVRGGPRHRLFWKGCGLDFPSPFLKKIPLFKYRPELMLTASTHNLEGAQFARATGLLLHFKFLQDFARSAAEEVQREEHFMGARQYVAYHNVLGAETLEARGLSLAYSGSASFEDSWELFDRGFMVLGQEHALLQRRPIRQQKKRPNEGRC